MTDGLQVKLQESMMNILIIDAQGGGIGKMLVTAIKENFPESDVTAVGTNSVATTAMLRAGADHGATGENPVLAACRTADVIVGPIGIVIADAMYGEITPVMAKAVGQSRARRILIPVNQCGNIIAGVPEMNMKRRIDCAVDEVRKYINGS